MSIEFLYSDVFKHYIKLFGWRVKKYAVQKIDYINETITNDSEKTVEIDFSLN